jgi:CRISPR/Cas system CSM-associated protein Csm2 small subunit
MTPEQRLKWDSGNYKKILEANKGSNYEYWTEKHEKMLQNGWSLFLITKTPTRQWNKLFQSNSTSSKEHAEKYIKQLREENNFARIVCGYNKNRQRIKMYSIIFKSKK